MKTLTPDPEFFYISDCIKAWKPQRVLEVGCNFGRELKSIDHLTQVYGIDKDPEKIKEAQKYVPKGTFKVADAVVGIPFPDNYFDFVYSDGCLSHCPPDWLPKILTEMIRVSRGRVVILEYMGTRTSSTGFSNSKSNTWLHDYDSIFLGNSNDVTTSKTVVVGLDAFTFMILTKGLLLPKSRNALGLPTSTWLVIATFAGMIIVTYVFPKVWEVFDRVFRALIGK